MNPPEIHVHIGRLSLDAAAVPGGAAAFGESLRAAIALRLGGEGGAPATPNALVDAVAAAVRARVVAEGPVGLAMPPEAAP